MRVSAITFNNFNNYNPNFNVQNPEDNNMLQSILAQCGTDLKCLPCYYPINFTGIQNSSKLRMLFAYKLPCMYSGIPMIDPKMLTRWIRNKVFSRPASQVLEILEPHKDSFTGIEAKVLDVIRERSAIHPDKNIKEILKEVEPVFIRRLRKKQAAIFRELSQEAQLLPDKYQYRFKMFMEETDKKLNNKPVAIPFSSYEFKYKLAKIKDDIQNGQDIKSKKVMNKLLKESKKLHNTTSSRTIEDQKKIVNFLEIILKKSVLKNNEQLRNLIEVSKSRLAQDKIIVPFNRKSFIYDLARLIEDLPDKKMQENLLTIAQKLPTSQESTSAYIVKVLSEPVDKIGYRLVWPSLASVEHILPKSEGGLDMMANFGGATTRENSMRKSIPFVQQMKRRPLTPLYCQKYVDRLIELYHSGVFGRLNVSPKYIVDFKNTILVQSRNRINLDISRLYRKPAA